MKTGWYNNEYIVVKPLKNGCRQSLIMGAKKISACKWWLSAGVFSCNIGYMGMLHSESWSKRTCTNKNPSAQMLTIALEALKEIEHEIYSHTDGKSAYLYIDGSDERRLRIYTKVLTKKCDFKISTSKSYCTELPLLYKRIK